jgi:MOSC domain-containing protein YiiM
MPTGRIASINISPGGVPKTPVERARVRRLGLDGDGHRSPTHGGPFAAVSIYSLEAIARVAADGHQAFPGAYGENLTLEGLELDTFRAGDLLRVGDAGLVLELRSRAEPCVNLSRWFVDERIGRVASKAYPADARWYAAVLEEGPVATGDAVELVRTA